MKEHKFPFNSFIGGWYIDKKICDNIIDAFKKHEHMAVAGSTAMGIDLKKKDSKDVGVCYDNFSEPFGEYRTNLQNCLLKYGEKYKYANEMDSFNIMTNYNIQYYKPGGGFKQWHFENGKVYHRHRVLAFMTYLNDVEDGGTEFFYQKIKSPAKKGLTIIWPAYFTHTHKGQISKTKEKFIATGWYSYMGLDNYE